MDPGDLRWPEEDKQRKAPVPFATEDLGTNDLELGPVAIMVIRALQFLFVLAIFSWVLDWLIS